MVEVSGDSLALPEIYSVAHLGDEVQLGSGVRDKMIRSRETVDDIIEGGRVVYGVNTGFGKLSDITIPHSELAALQLNLVRSHACGVGEPLSEPEVRAMLLLRANVLAKGFSGARYVVAETLVEMLNKGVTPHIPCRGSVGASGDLAPLAHLALVVIGEGKAYYEGELLPGGEAMQRAGIAPITLAAKEGLALLNGTQAMVAVGSLALFQAQALWDRANVAGAMTLEALKGTPAAFDARIHEVRPHQGQQLCAQSLLELLAGSEIRESHLENDPRVQDAYCLRCMPQVHGATYDAIRFAADVLEVESGSATDNPLVFDNGDVISGGNFHGAPVAQALDFAAIALTDMAAMSERRVDRLLNPDSNEGLPAFLAPKPGTSSGFMIAHVTAAALLTECKVLSHPASVDTIPTSAGKEDHVSMGMTSALKLRQIVLNVGHILAIELMCAAQGLESRRPLRAGVGVEEAYAEVRRLVPALGEDRVLSDDIERLARMH